MTQPRNIVITGSTRGIGYGLAEAFLALGCTATISGRSAQACNTAAQALCQTYPPERILTLPCDVTNFDQVQNLWDKTFQRFGSVDIWINNAGYSGKEGMVWECSADDLQAVIAANIMGTVYGTQAAVRGMLAQGWGAIYNMEGMGSDGRKHAGLTTYGTSKYAVHYFTMSTVKELQGKPVILAALRPGMVITDLITARFQDRPAELERLKPLFNILADRVENVAPWLAHKILANRKSGAIISYASPMKYLWRLATNPLTRRDVFTNLLN